MKKICLISEKDKMTAQLSDILHDQYDVVSTMEQMDDAAAPDLIMIAGLEDFYAALPLPSAYADVPVVFIKEDAEHFCILTLRELQHAVCRRIARDSLSLLHCVEDVMTAEVFPKETVLRSEQESDLCEIQSDIRKSYQAPAEDGAIQVEYHNFASIYRFVEKLVERSGQCVQTMLLTLIPRKNTEVTVEDLQLAMSKLAAAIHMTLRKNDVLTGCSCTQILVLLMDADDDGGHMAANRILNTFLGLYESDAFELHYDIRPVSGGSHEKADR